MTVRNGSQSSAVRQIRPQSGGHSPRYSARTTSAAYTPRMTPATSIAISVATLRARRAMPPRERRERMYGRAERMSSTGTAAGSASRTGFVLKGATIVEAGTLGNRVPRPRLRPRRGRRGAAPARRPARRARPHPDERHRQGGRLRSDVRRLRDVRLRRRTSLRVYAAALRLLSRADLLDLRTALGDRRDRADRSRRRHGAPRLRDRAARRLEYRGGDRSCARDVAPVSRLARRPPEPRDPRSVPRRGNCVADARPRITADDPRGRAARARARSWNPRQRATRRVAAGRSVLRALARRPAPRSARRGRRVARGDRARGRAVGDPQSSVRRLRRDHDRREGAVEGERRQHVSHAHARRLDRRRPELSGRAADTRAGVRLLPGV